MQFGSDPVRAAGRAVLARAPRQGRALRCALGATCALLLAMSSLATTAMAEITPEARRVVDRYLEAIGGRAAFEAVQTVHGHGIVKAFGFSGEIDTWTARPDKRASRMGIGPLKIQQGYDGRIAWRTDPGGKVIRLDGLDLERSVASTWFDANRWLEADQAGGKVRIATEQKVEGPYDVLSVESPGGEARLIWVHRETGFIDRIVARSDQRTMINTLSEYKTFGGVRFATLVTTSIEGMPDNDVVVTFESLEVNGDMADAPFGMPGDQAGAVRYLKTPGLARLAFDYSGKHLWLRASVNGHPPADFIFDTGASITVIDSVYAASIGLATEGALRGQGAGASGSASLGRLETLSVEGGDGDGVALDDIPVAVLSVNTTLEPFFWRPCAGILGFNFINQFVCEIDYDTHTLALHEPKDFEYQGAGQPIPMTLAGSAPAIAMTIDGVYEGQFRVDVGSSATVDLHRPFVRAHGIDERVKKSVTVVSGGFGGTFTSRLTRMKSLAIGPFEWKDPMVSLSGAESGALASEDFAGNIGNRILERFKCTFDYERRVLHLEPGRRYGDRDGFSRSGLQLVRVGDVVTIAQVIEGSPAAKAGIREGDVVRAIDGTAAAEWTRDDLEALFEEGKPGRKVAFELTRGGAARKAVIRLREVI